jgi:hypothetical protein
VNARWLNVLAVAIIATLIVLSGILVITTVFSSVSASAAALGVIVVLVVGVGLAVVWLRLQRARGTTPAPSPPIPRSERSTWRMPPLALLKPVTWSPATRLGMIVLRSYLVISVILLIVKAVRIGGG